MLDNIGNSPITGRDYSLSGNNYPRLLVRWRVAAASAASIYEIKPDSPPLPLLFLSLSFSVETRRRSHVRATLPSRLLYRYFEFHINANGPPIALSVGY